MSTKISSGWSLDRELEFVMTLPLVKQRAIFAIIGSAVADAAVRPFHWVYDTQKLATIVDSSPCPEFWSTSMSPYYSMPTGCRSCYSDEALAMLRSLSPLADSTSLSSILLTNYKEQLCSMFSDNSAYAVSLAGRPYIYDHTMQLDANQEKRSEERVVVAGPWMNGSVITFLKKNQQGEDQSGNTSLQETDGMCGAIPLVGRLAAAEAGSRLHEERDLFVKVASVLNASDGAIAYSLATAVRVIHNCSPSFLVQPCHLYESTDSTRVFHPFVTACD